MNTLIKSDDLHAADLQKFWKSEDHVHKPKLTTQNVSPVKFKENNLIQYQMSPYSTSNMKGALLHRGANGCMTGDDVQVIAK